jgi:hypothetical protein
MANQKDKAENDAEGKKLAAQITAKQIESGQLQLNAVNTHLNPAPIAPPPVQPNLLAPGMPGIGQYFSPPAMPAAPMGAPAVGPLAANVEHVTRPLNPDEQRRMLTSTMAGKASGMDTVQSAPKPIPETQYEMDEIALKRQRLKDDENSPDTPKAGASEKAARIRAIQSIAKDAADQLANDKLNGNPEDTNVRKSYESAMSALKKEAQIKDTVKPAADGKTGSKIRVKRKDGAVGTIDAKDFDASKYTRI